MPPRLRPGDLTALFLVLVLVAAILAVALLQHIGALLMRHRKLLLVAAAALSAFALTACGTTGAKVLDNVNESCDRQYDGAISAGITGGQFTGTFKAKCYRSRGEPAAEAAAPAQP